MSGSSSTRARSELNSLLRRCAVVMCGLALWLIGTSQSTGPRLRSSPSQPKREPQFLYGPLDGLTESEALSLPFTWGTDHGVPWLQWNGHRYFHDERDWRFCGQGVRV